jgi:hypothetical protein
MRADNPLPLLPPPGAMPSLAPDNPTRRPTVSAVGMPQVPTRAKRRQRAPHHEFCKTNPPAKTAAHNPPSCLRAFVVQHPAGAKRTQARATGCNALQPDATRCNHPRPAKRTHHNGQWPMDTAPPRTPMQLPRAPAVLTYGIPL